MRALEEDPDREAIQAARRRHPAKGRLTIAEQQGIWDAAWERIEAFLAAEFADTEGQR